MSAKNNGTHLWKLIKGKYAIKNYEDFTNDMTKNNLPMWRIDNLYGFAMVVIGAVFTILFNYFSLIGDIREIKQDLKYVVKKQDELVNDVSQWKRQFEGRLGGNEVKIAEIAAVLKIKL